MGLAMKIIAAGVLVLFISLDGLYFKCMICVVSLVWNEYCTERTLFFSLPFRAGMRYYL
jgi:hypothetical protein